MTIIHRVLLSPLHCANGYDAQLYMWFLLHDLFTEVLQLLRTSIALCPRQLMALTVTVEFGGGESPIGPPNGSPIRYIQRGIYKETTVYFISNTLESHLLYCMFTIFFTVSVLTFTHLQYITHFSPGAILCYVGLFSHSILLVPGKQDALLVRIPLLELSLLSTSLPDYAFTFFHHSFSLPCKHNIGREIHGLKHLQYQTQRTKAICARLCSLITQGLSKVVLH